MAIAAPALTDEDIQQQVVNELTWDAEVEAREIGVAVRGGLVTLTGWVDRFGAKWAAERATLRVRGFKAVADEIEVRLPAGGERTDLDIAAAAAHAQSWVERPKAERVAWSAPGVTEVQNHIAVRP